jgi:hypothetical protein
MVGNVIIITWTFTLLLQSACHPRNLDEDYPIWSINFPWRCKLQQPTNASNATPSPVLKSLDNAFYI